MIKQIVFVVCVIILIFAGMQVLGYLGDGLGVVSSKITGIADMIGSSMDQINGITSMTTNLPTDPSEMANVDDPMKYAESLDFLSGIENSELGHTVKNLFGLN